jgi:hypothetical protein
LSEWGLSGYGNVTQAQGGSRNGWVCGYFPFELIDKCVTQSQTCFQIHY